MPEGMRMLKPPAASATSRGTIACAGHLFQACPVRQSASLAPMIAKVASCTLPLRQCPLRAELRCAGRHMHSLAV